MTNANNQLKWTSWGDERVSGRNSPQLRFVAPKRFLITRSRSRSVERSPSSLISFRGCLFIHKNPRCRQQTEKYPIKLFGALDLARNQQTNNLFRIFRSVISICSVLIIIYVVAEIIAAVRTQSLCKLMNGFASYKQMICS